MQSIYSIKIALISDQLDFYTTQELDNIKNIALFVALFHAPWYFKCCLPSSAPMLHLKTISQMKRAQRFIPDLAPVVLKSISLHLWYLTPQCVPLALVDETLSGDQRSSLAVGIANTPRPEVYPLGKPSFPDLSSIPDRFWKSGKVPELSSFLGPQSWRMFDKLGLTAEDMDWLELDPVIWETSSSYLKFKNFALNLTIVNDPAERGEGLVKEFISSFQSEPSCQANLLAVSKHRAVIQKNSRKESLAKIGLK